MSMQSWSRARRFCAFVFFGRPLFLGCGGFENASDATELVFNAQANGLFIDLRIPTLRSKLVNIAGTATSLRDLSDIELRCLARQHVFGGFSRIAGVEKRRIGPMPAQNFHICTRHHFIDWNFIGHPRNRPNKWIIQHPTGRFASPTADGGQSYWLEHSYTNAKETGQPYYYERWQRLPGDGCGNRLVLSFISAPGAIKTIFIILGNRFSFLIQPQDRTKLARRKLVTGKYFRC